MKEHEYEPTFFISIHAPMLGATSASLGLTHP